MVSFLRSPPSARPSTLSHFSPPARPRKWPGGGAPRAGGGNFLPGSRLMTAPARRPVHLRLCDPPFCKWSPVRPEYKPGTNQVFSAAFDSHTALTHESHTHQRYIGESARGSGTKSSQRTAAPRIFCPAIRQLPHPHRAALKALRVASPAAFTPRLYISKITAGRNSFGERYGERPARDPAS